MWAMTLWFFVCAVPSEADWTLKETGIYSPIHGDNATVNDAGETFLLDRKESRVIKIDPNGEKALEFGRRGKGPGEMSFPRSIAALGELVYVFDGMGRKMLIFDRQGTYKDQQIISENLYKMAKVDGGWVTSHGVFAGEKAGHLTLKWHDEAMKEEKILVEFSPDPAGKGKSKNQKPRFDAENKKFYSPYNPSPEMIHFGVVQQGSRIIVVHPGTRLKITIHDGANGDIITTISDDNNPIPFNKTWGEESFERIQKAFKSRQAKSPITTEPFPDFPDFFPYARMLWAHEDGHFHLLPWNPRADFNSEVLGFNLKGERTTHELTSRDLINVVHMNSSHAWVRLFDEEEEEAGIARIPRSKLASFVKKQYPANPDTRSPEP